MNNRNTFLTFTFLSFFLFTANAQKISVRYKSDTQKSFSGNVYLYLSKENKSPKDGRVGIDAFPCFRIAVKDIKPNEAVLFDDAAISYPVPLTDIERGTYYAQIVWDNNLGGRAIAGSPGNIYNKVVQVIFSKDRNDFFDIVCDQIIPVENFEETDFVREIKVPSKLLTSFYGRPTTINAAVWLPEKYNVYKDRRYPVLYFVYGYGGDYHRMSGMANANAPMDTTPCIRVILDGQCPLGHSVYANSDNNGPWGDALTKELIPEIERKFRCDSARFLAGHSSGGWTVLWLQSHYPRIFTACWSSSPDPVDFRSFQRINLYTDKNMYYGKDSTLHEMATVAGKIPWASQKQAYQMENVISRGEQMHSFNAVFSPRNNNGSPGELCDAVTGAIHSEIAEHWKKYDISLYLRTNWPELQSDLHGKIRVSVGEQDNFLLNDAVHLFDQEMHKLNTGFIFAYYPGDHFTVGTLEYRDAGFKFLETKYNEFKVKQQIEK